jgi:hypothetical protein
VADIFREIDEDLRRDRLEKLWAKYGKYLVLAAILALGITIAVVAWRDYQRRQRDAEALRFTQAMELARQGQEAKAADAFAALGQEAGSGYAVLARLEAAATKARSGDREGAVAAYDGIAADTRIGQTYRDLATLMAALQSIDTADAAAMVERLKPLVAPGNPWRFSAGELTALAKLKSGDRAGARQAYQSLADDLEAPAGLRARAAEMVQALTAQGE